MMHCTSPHDIAPHSFIMADCIIVHNLTLESIVHKQEDDKMMSDGMDKT